MTEYLSEAIVLRREPFAEFDNRFSFFTKRYGKLVAKGKSTRKITSKLSGHLLEGNLVRARLIEKNGLQVVDALKTQSLPHFSTQDLLLLDELVAEAEPDAALWDLFLSPAFSWQKVLKILGWDPEGATCDMCGKYSPSYFVPRSQTFLCDSCLRTSRVGKSALLYIAKDR